MKDRFGDITVAVMAHVAWVEIRRPPHNFFDVGLVTSLADVFEELDAERECRAIVLCSEGKSFCAGADFRNSQVPDPAETGGVNPVYEQAARLFSNRKPIVAAVQGPAVGGGLGLALLADFRVASPEARFVANFVKVGVHPGFGLTYTLPKLVGQQHASEMFLTGRRIAGEEAARWGLADRLAPQGALRTEAGALAAEIAEGAPLAVQSTRHTLRRHFAEAVREHTFREASEQAWLSRTQDHQEGVRAVGEKRPGDFQSR